MHISEQGQLPIPQKIIKKLGFTKTTPLEYVVQGDELVVRRKSPKNAPKKKLSRGKAFIKHLQSFGPLDMTTEEIMRMTRGDDWGR